MSNLSQSQFGFHAASKKHRSAIESEGLKPQSNDQGYTPGVYAAASSNDLESYLGDSTPNKDIYHVEIGKAHPDPMYHGAVYSPDAVPAHKVKRVGHTDAEGAIHWKPE